ncbi:MAG: hypothetical protein J3Q66DRAFT_440307 [Benniella sp.]|nr:MAG: hypothetical protein J3Q66DRAFT_440307 [Benniella sp.]
MASKMSQSMETMLSIDLRSAEDAARSWNGASFRRLDILFKFKGRGQSHKNLVPDLHHRRACQVDLIRTSGTIRIRKQERYTIIITQATWAGTLCGIAGSYWTTAPVVPQSFYQ